MPYAGERTYRTLTITEDGSIPVPKDYAARIMLWQAVDLSLSPGEPKNQTAAKLVNTTVIAADITAQGAKELLQDELHDGLLAYPPTEDRAIMGPGILPTLYGKPRTRDIAPTFFGLQVAAESARRVITHPDPQKRPTAKKAERVYQAATAHIIRSTINGMPDEIYRWPYYCGDKRAI